MEDPLIDEFLIYLEIEKGYSKATIREYKYDLNLFKRFVQKSLDHVTTGDLRKFLYYLKKERNSSAKTIHRKICSIRSFYKFLSKEHYISKNPTENIETPKIPKSLPKTLSQEEVLKLLKAPKSLRDRAILALLYSSGLRVSELCSLKVRDVNFEEGHLKVVSGKGAKDRFVPVAPFVIDLLKRYIKQRNEDFASDSPLFLSRRGGALTPRTIQRMIKKYKEKAKINRPVTPHTLRHAFATHLIENKVDIRLIQELLGHASLSTTQLYTHISLGHLKSVYLESHPLTQLSRPL